MQQTIVSAEDTDQPQGERGHKTSIQLSVS